MWFLWWVPSPQSYLYGNEMFLLLRVDFWYNPERYGSIPSCTFQWYSFYYNFPKITIRDILSTMKKMMKSVKFDHFVKRLFTILNSLVIPFDYRLKFSLLLLQSKPLILFFSIDEINLAFSVLEDLLWLRWEVTDVFAPFWWIDSVVFDLKDRREHRIFIWVKDIIFFYLSTAFFTNMASSFRLFLLFIISKSIISDIAEIIHVWCTYYSIRSTQDRSLGVWDNITFAFFSLKMRRQTTVQIKNFSKFLSIFF